MDATKFLEHSIREYPGQLTAVIVPVLCVAPFMLRKLFNNINGATHSTGTMTAANPCLFNGKGGGGVSMGHLSTVWDMSPYRGGGGYFFYELLMALYFF